MSMKEVAAQDSFVFNSLYDLKGTWVFTPSIASPLTVLIEAKTLGLRGGGFPSYTSTKCFTSNTNTDTAAPVSTRQRAGFPLILTSTERSLGLHILVELVAMDVLGGIVGCPESKARNSVGLSCAVLGTVWWVGAGVLVSPVTVTGLLIRSEVWFPGVSVAGLPIVIPGLSFLPCT